MGVRSGALVALAALALAALAMAAGASSAASEGPAGVAPDSPEVNEREFYQDEHETCWTYGAIESRDPAFGRQGCCWPRPCGVPDCWSPPEFVYSFCCEEPACSDNVTQWIQRALRAAVASELPFGNASRVAYRTSPSAFRAMLHGGLAGLQLWMSEGHLKSIGSQWNQTLPKLGQSCECAVAYAAAVLLEPHGQVHRGEVESLTPTWFLQALKWSEVVNRGWGALFAWLRLLPTGGREPSASAPRGVGRSSSVTTEPESLDQFLDKSQRAAQWFWDTQGAEKRRGAGFLEFVATMQSLGVWDRVWGRIWEELASRTHGRKCAAALDGRNDHGHGMPWSSCEPWEYSPDADYSSPEPLASGAAKPGSEVAACVLGAPRNIRDTYTRLRVNVLLELEADAFAFIPFAETFDRKLEWKMKLLGPVVTAIAVPDVDQEGMEARILGELQNEELARAALMAPGPWRAPVYGQMGSSMWGYHMQDVCVRMVQAYEGQRGREYKWVVLLRSDMMWSHRHPPVSLMDPGFVYVPFGQDNSFYNYGPEPGLNDRHAVVPRHLMRDYFGRWETLKTGEALLYMHQSLLNDTMINTEQYLLLHLRHQGVPVRRFPPVAFVVLCAPGPQCVHLYKGTNAGNRPWAYTAKYMTELFEVRRTLKDDEYGRVDRVKLGWIWHRLEPHTPLDRDHQDLARPWMWWGIDLGCCFTRSGPVSCYQWFFLKRCMSLAGRGRGRILR